MENNIPKGDYCFVYGEVDCPHFGACNGTAGCSEIPNEYWAVSRFDGFAVKHPDCPSLKGGA